MNTKLYVVTRRNGRPLDFFMTAGQISDYTGAVAHLDVGYQSNECWQTGAEIQTMQPYRDHVRETQKLETGRNTL